MFRAFDIHLALAIVIGLAGLALGRNSAPAPQAAVGRIDGDKWARREIDLIRRELVAPARDNQGRVHLTALGFSVVYNPLLLRDPYAAEVAATAEAYLPRAGKEEEADEIRRIVALFRRPEAERRRLDIDQIRAAIHPPEPPRPARPLDPGDAQPRPRLDIDEYLRLPTDHRAAREAEAVAALEESARASGDWGRLGFNYFRLAREATQAGDRPRADQYIDRVLAVIAEHPALMDPARGNVNGVPPTGLAALLTETGRRDRWDAFLASLPAATRAELAIGEVGDLALGGKFDVARAVIDRQVRPIRPDAAARLDAAARGEITMPPAPRRALGVPNPSPEEGRLRQVQEYFAYAHATRGEVETAGRMLIALQRDQAHYPAGEGRLASFEWALLALRAAAAGHRDAARLGFDRANAMMEHDFLLTPDRRAEKARLVQEAVSLGEFDIANSMHQTTSAPGAWTRLNLALVYRKRGDNARAAALLDEGVALAYLDISKEGATLALIAVELQRIGQPDRAERALLDSLSRIHGEDFGFSGGANVVDAAVAMDRVDLLDRLYDQGTTSDRLILSLAACRRAELTEASP